MLRLYRTCTAGAASFRHFQVAMRQLLAEMKARGPPGPKENDVSAALSRVLHEAQRARAEVGWAGAVCFLIRIPWCPQLKIPHSRGGCMHSSAGCHLLICMEAASASAGPRHNA